MKGASAAVLLLPLVFTACATRGSVTRARAEITALGEGIEAVRRAQDKIARELSAVVAQLRADEERAAVIAPRMDEQAEAVRKLSERADGVEASLARVRTVVESAAREVVPSTVRASLQGEALTFRDTVRNLTILMLLAGVDSTTPEEFEEFAGKVRAQGVEVESHTYPGAPHSFFDRTQEQWKEASDDAWRRILDFTERQARVASSTA